MRDVRGLGAKRGNEGLRAIKIIKAFEAMSIGFKQVYGNRPIEGMQGKIKT